MPLPSLPQVLNWQILLPGSVLMRGFAFQVDRLVAKIEDHQLLHELSLEDDVEEELPRQLDLSVGSSDSSMSGVAPLPPDSAQDSAVQESGAARLPPDNLEDDVIQDIPVPSACSMPVHSSAPPTSGVSHAKAVVSTAVWKSFPVLHSDTSCSPSSSLLGSFVMEQEEPTSVGVEPDSQTVESMAPQGISTSPTASQLVFTEAVIHSSSAAATSPMHQSSVQELPRTPQHVPPSLLWEAASSDVLGAAGWSEDPASTIQESVADNPSVPLLDLTSAILGALSAQEGSNNAPVDGVTVSGEAGCPSSSILSKDPDLRRESTDKDSMADYSSDHEEANKCTHPVSPLAHVDTPGHPVSSSSSVPDHPVLSSLSVHDQQIHISTSPASSSVDHLWSSPHGSPRHSSSPKQPVDLPDVMGKLAPMDQLLFGSGRLSPELPNPPVSATNQKLPLPGGSHSPDHTELSGDSSKQLHAEEEVKQEVESTESDLGPSSALDVTLESGDSVPIDWAVVEQLCAWAAKQASLWEDCLSHMTVNEHPHCEYPHVYRVRVDMVYYIKTEIPGQMSCYDELHERLLRNDVTTSVIKQTNPFVVCHVVAHLLCNDYSIPVDLLPSLECFLHSHCHDITTRKDELWEFIGRMDQKLHQISLQEAATPTKAVVVGCIVPSQQDSNSSYQSQEAVQLDSPKTAYKEVKQMLPPGRSSWQTSFISPLLNVQLQIARTIHGGIWTSVHHLSGPLDHFVRTDYAFPSCSRGVSSLGRKLCRSQLV